MLLRNLVKKNPQISMKLIGAKQGGALVTIIKLAKDKSPGTRLLACTCLTNVGCACPSSYPQEWERGVLAKVSTEQRRESSSFQENAGDCRLAVLGAMLDDL